VAGEPFATLAAAQYVSLTTYRRSGEGVSTPLWIAGDVDGGERLLVWTERDSGKVKRLGHTPAVALAPCTFGGKLLGETANGTARVLPDGELRRVRRAMAAKYGVQFRLTAGLGDLRRRFLRGPPVVGLEITLD
jgi:PPOX class probable F420-dependent enzyme